MLKFKTFISKQSLADWANGKDGTDYIISINKDMVNGEWIIWYIDETKEKLR